MTRFCKIFFLVAFSMLMCMGVELSAQTQAAAENSIIDAVSKFNERDYAGASIILEEILKKYPENDAAHYYLGMCNVYLDKMPEAEKRLKKAVELDSTNFWYRSRLATYYMITKEPEMTVAIYEDLLKDFPKKTDIYFELIDLYLAQKQNEKALETLDQIETLFGKNEPTAMTRFQLLNQMGQAEQAYKNLEEFNKEYSSAQVAVVLGDYQLQMYKDSLAIAYYDEALDLMPGYPAALVGKAEAYRLSRNYDKFFPVLTEFVKNENLIPIAKAEYVKALYTRSDPKFIMRYMPQMDVLLNSFVEAHPGDSTSLTTAGLYYYTTGRNDKAKECLKKTVELYPESLSASASYAELLAYLKDWAELSRFGREASEKFPQEPGFIEMAVGADYNSGRIDDAISLAKTIVKTSAKDTSKLMYAYSILGDMYHEKGDSKKAYQAYDKALKINPTYSPVLNNYAYFLSLEGKKLSKAAKMSKITVDKEPDNPTYLDTYGWILHLQGKSAEAKPLFKHAMLYGGKESAVILDHYAEVLYSLGEYDLAYMYWRQAAAKNKGELINLDEKVAERKQKEKK
jgi:tetratricopeptide (TPR) repeat protein